MKYNWSKENIENAIKISDSYSETLLNLNIPKSGRNLDTLKRKILEYNIDINHFTFTSHYKKFKGLNSVDVNNYLKENINIKPYRLKMRLLSAGLKENKCECCGITEWNNLPITCQLHHINGNETDNRIENLLMLCPNCHSLTDNYCGKSNKTENYCPDCGVKICKKSKYCRKCYRNHLY